MSYPYQASSLSGPSTPVGQHWFWVMVEDSPPINAHTKDMGIGWLVIMNEWMNGWLKAHQHTNAKVDVKNYFLDALFSYQSHQWKCMRGAAQSIAKLRHLMHTSTARQIPWGAVTQSNSQEVQEVLKHWPPTIETYIKNISLSWEIKKSEWICWWLVVMTYSGVHWWGPLCMSARLSSASVATPPISPSLPSYSGQSGMTTWPGGGVSS